MKLRILPLLVAGLALPALAQDRSFAIFLDKAPGVDGTFNQSGSVTHLKTSDYSGFGIKFGANVAKWGPATLEFNASYRFKGKEDLTITPGFGQTAQFEWSYLSAGADVNFTKVVDFGGGLDLRAQQSKLIFQSGSTSQEIGVNRFSPWIRAHVGYTFHAGAVSPFVALEGAWDLSAKDSYDVGTTDIDANKAYGVASPKSEYSLQLGLRF